VGEDYIKMSKVLEEKFWEKAVRQTDNECWNWSGNINSNGYGRVLIKKEHIFAHRASWMIHFGEIPKGMHVCHHCDNRACINPVHLFLGTNLDNINDKMKKGRQSRGIERPAAKLDNNKVRKIRYLFHEREYSNKKLSMMFNVAKSQISEVVHYKSWRHVK